MHNTTTQHNAHNVKQNRTETEQMPDIAGLLHTCGKLNRLAGGKLHDLQINVKKLYCDTENML